MQTIKSHLAGMHSKAAGTHSELADSCAKLAGHFDEMSKVAESKYASLSSEFSHMAKAHQSASEYHTGCAETMKAAADADLNKMVPDNVRGIIPSDVAFGSRAVVRTGQPELNKVSVDGIDPKFRHLITMQDEV